MMKVQCPIWSVRIIVGKIVPFYRLLIYALMFLEQDSF